MDRIERNYYLNQLIEKRDNGRVKVITGRDVKGTGTCHPRNDGTTRKVVKK